MAERRLQILQVSTADIQGGAEKVAWNLFTTYRAHGHCSWLAVGKKRSNDSNVRIIPNQQARGRGYHFFQGISSRLQQTDGKHSVVSPLNRLAGILAEPGRRFDLYHGIEDFHFPGTSRLLTLFGGWPDILHAHNLHGGYFDLRMLPWLSRQVPVFITLHDAWLLSGHCAHSFSCEKWKTGCGKCPDLTIYPDIQRDATSYNWRRKREIYARSRLYVATPSHWLMSRVEESILAPGVAEARILPNGVDLDTFQPTDRQTARAELGLQQEAKVLLSTGIMVKENRWKDYWTLREAVARAAEQPGLQNLQLIVLGGDAPPERIGQANIRFIPFQEEAKIVARYYQAADLYVHAALADTFPFGVLEALACGTQVVATAVGGIPEQVEEGRTGFLVPAGEAAEMAARIVQLLSEQNINKGMGGMAAESARRKFGLGRQTDAYLDWYHELVREKTRRIKD